eukprot:TRINITY_DN14115_c0_g1_i1.p1 TRINITY_DN14115_c0_g1~~TRINITY_DN14115_c0_g1_i1.p1  ORF type:complete len:387 (+),score=75.56 TRINITY_DN14115_c0_g1_i1:129-1289(+)
MSKKNAVAALQKPIVFTEPLEVLGREGNSGVRMLIELRDETLLTCGADGCLKRWKKTKKPQLNDGAGYYNSGRDEEQYRVVQEFEGKCSIECIEELDEESFLSGDSRGYISRWSLETGKQLFTTRANSCAVTAIVALRNNDNNSTEIFLSCSKDDNMRIVWSIEPLRNVANRLVEEHINEPHFMRRLDDGFVVMNDTHMIDIWDAANFKTSQLLVGHSRTVTDAIELKRKQLDDGGALLVSCSLDKTVKLWNREKELCLRTINSISVVALTLLHDGSSFAAFLDQPKAEVRGWSHEGECVMFKYYCSSSTSASSKRSVAVGSRRLIQMRNSTIAVATDEGTVELFEHSPTLVHLCCRSVMREKRLTIHQLKKTLPRELIEMCEQYE